MNKKSALLIIFASVFSISVFVGTFIYLDKKSERVNNEAYNEAVADVAKIQTKLQEFYDKNGNFPDQIQGLRVLDLEEAAENSIDSSYFLYYRASSSETGTCRYTLQAKESSAFGDTSTVKNEVKENKCEN